MLTFQENPARVVLEYDATSVYKVMEALASFGSVRVEKEAPGPRPAAAAQQPTPSGPQVGQGLLVAGQGARGRGQRE